MFSYQLKARILRFHLPDHIAVRHDPAENSAVEDDSFDLLWNKKATNVSVQDLGDRLVIGRYDTVRDEMHHSETIAWRRTYVPTLHKELTRALRKDGVDVTGGGHV